MFSYSVIDRTLNFSSRAQNGSLDTSVSHTTTEIAVHMLDDFLFGLVHNFWPATPWLA
jgi:hypothetical protein